MGDGALLHRDMALEVGLYFVRGFPAGQAKAVGYPEHVGVHGYYGLVVEDGGHYVGGFAADSGQGHEAVGVGGYHGMEVADQFPGHVYEVDVYEVAGLAVGVGDGADDGQDFLE